MRQDDRRHRRLLDRGDRGPVEHYSQVPEDVENPQADAHTSEPGPIHPPDRDASPLQTQGKGEKDNECR